MIDEFISSGEASWVNALTSSCYCRMVTKGRARTNVAIVCVEQLYPVPQRRLAAALDRYPKATEVCWVQERGGESDPDPAAVCVCAAHGLVGLRI